MAPCNCCSPGAWSGRPDSAEQPGGQGARGKRDARRGRGALSAPSRRGPRDLTRRLPSPVNRWRAHSSSALPTESTTVPDFSDGRDLTYVFDRDLKLLTQMVGLD